MQNHLLRNVVFAVVLYLFGISANIYAYSSGVTGRTLRDATNGCSCHSSSASTATTVTIAGPATLTAGATGAYTVTITRSGSFNSGVDIAASGGSLAPVSSYLKLSGTELVHNKNVSGTDALVYNFNFTAPTSAGTITLYATGAGSSSGTPAWNFAPNFTVTVNADSTVDTTKTDSNLFWAENFDYPAGDSLNGIHGGWASHSATGQFPPSIVSPGLSYVGYPSSGIGNAVRLIAQGEDVNKKVPNAADSVISGSVYLSFLVRVDSAKAAGDIFMHLGQYAFYSASAQRCRIYAKAASAGSQNVAFGIFKGSSTTVTTPKYTDTIYQIGTTYLIVAKYTFVSGTLNDYCDLWVNPNLTQTEPAPMLTDSSYTVSDLNSVGSVCLRQGAWASSPSVVIDGIRFAKAWSSLGSTVTSVANQADERVTSFKVYQNFPNPFNPSTRISYNLTQTGSVRITVYDVLGRSLQTLRDGVENSGYHEVVWNARSANGTVLPSGIYFCRVQSGNQSKVIKMLLNK